MDLNFRHCTLLVCCDSLGCPVEELHLLFKLHSEGLVFGSFTEFSFFSAHLATAVPGGVPSFTESDAIGRPHYAAAESVFVFLCFCVFHFWVGRTHIFLGFFGLSFLRYIPKLATDFSFTSPCLPRQTGSCGC